MTACALFAHDTASLGARALRIRGTGAEAARLLRLVLLAATRWPGREQHDPWHSNETLAAITGLAARQVERALAVLRSAGELVSRYGPRAGARRRIGRLLKLGLHAPVKALAPAGADIRNLWAIGRAARARPAALITAMVGAYMLASDHTGGAIEDWADLGCSMSDWRRFIGHRDNPSWTKRARELERLGLIRREGRRVIVSPPRAWFALAVAATESNLQLPVPVKRRSGTPGGEPELRTRAVGESAHLHEVDTRHVAAPAARVVADAPPVEVDDAPGIETSPSPWVEVFEHVEETHRPPGILRRCLGRLHGLAPPARLSRVDHAPEEHDQRHRTTA